MITDFPSRPSRNSGGNRSFTFVPVNDISLFPTIYQYRILQNLVLQAGKQLLTGYATYETLVLSEKSQTTDDGMVVEAQISGFAPEDKAELLDLFYQMERMRFVVIITDAQGQPRIVGTKLNPLSFKCDFNSGERRADGSGITFQFYGNLKYKAPVYQVKPLFTATRTANFTRNNCDINFSGSTVPFSKEYTGYTQAEADGAAAADANFAALGQAFANGSGTCLQTTFLNTVQSQAFTRNNCAAGSTGTEVVYTVAAGTYSAATQAAANALALADVADNGQSNANNLGDCELNALVVIPITVTEGDSEFLDNNLLFNIGAAYANGFFNAGSGEFDMGRVGHTIIAQQNYYGGTIDSNNNPVSAWPYAVTATLQLKINGVVSPAHNLTNIFPADQPIGGLQSFQFVLEAGKTYEVICTVAQA